MHKNFWGWSLESISKGKVDTKYTVEMTDDSKVADELERTGDSDVLHKKEFDDVSKALEYYLRWFFDPKTVICKLWEQVYVNDELVLEQMVEPNGNTLWTLRGVIDNNTKKELMETQQNLEYMERNKDLYEKFIKCLGGQYEDMFKEFCKREENLL